MTQTEKKSQTRAQSSAAADALAQITARKIAPKPRWHFVLRNVALWSAGVAFVALGALFFSVLLLILLNEPWDMQQLIIADEAKHLAIVLPLLWALSFAVFLAVAEWALSHTKRAYRFSPLQITLVLAFVSAVLGAVLYAQGVAYKTDQAFGKYAPIHLSIEERREMLLYQPEQGRIFGRVVSIDGTTVTLVNDSVEEMWVIDAASVPAFKRERLMVGHEIALLGVVVEDERFTACDLRPLTKRGFGPPPAQQNQRAHDAYEKYEHETLGVTEEEEAEEERERALTPAQLPTPQMGQNTQQRGSIPSSCDDIMEPEALSQLRRANDARRELPNIEREEREEVGDESGESVEHSSDE